MKECWKKKWGIYTTRTSVFMGHMMSCQLHAPIALFPKTYPRYSSARRLRVPQSRFGQFGGKNLLSLPKTESRILNCPALRLITMLTELYRFHGGAIGHDWNYCARYLWHCVLIEAVTDAINRNSNGSATRRYADLLVVVSVIEWYDHTIIMCIHDKRASRMHRALHPHCSPG